MNRAFRSCWGLLREKNKTRFSRKSGCPWVPIQFENIWTTNVSPLWVCLLGVQKKVGTNFLIFQTRYQPLSFTSWKNSNPTGEKIRIFCVGFYFDRTATDGHPDFRSMTDFGYYLYSGIVAYGSVGYHKDLVYPAHVVRVVYHLNTINIVASP